METRDTEASLRKRGNRRDREKDDESTTKEQALHCIIVLPFS